MKISYCSAQAIGEGLRLHAGVWTQREIDEVGVLAADLDAGNLAQAFRQQRGIVMIVAQAVAHVVQRNQASCRQDARLPQAAAQRLSSAPRPLYEILVANQH